MSGARFWQSPCQSRSNGDKEKCGSHFSNLDSNSVREECICVSKVYDWVLVSNDKRNKLDIPEPLATEVKNILLQGIPVRTEVITPRVPSLFPIHCGVPASLQNINCSIIPPIRRVKIPSPVNGSLIDVSLVRFIFIINITVVLYREDTNVEIGRFDAAIQLDDDIVLCLPEPLNAENIRCRIVELCIIPSGIIFENAVEINVCLCQEIQVEADVKLEVLARFSHPRAPIHKPNYATVNTCIPEISFPQPCADIFPGGSCDCQGLINSTDENVLVQLPNGQLGSGVACLNAEICNNCNPVSTNILFRFTDSNRDPDLNKNFVFESQMMSALGCFDTLDQINNYIDTLDLSAELRNILTVINPNSIAVAIQGKGSISPNLGGSSSHLHYKLVLIDNAKPIPPTITPVRSVYIFIINDGVRDIFSTLVNVPSMSLEVRVCKQFPTPE